MKCLTLLNLKSNLILYKMSEYKKNAKYDYHLIIEEICILYWHFPMFSYNKCYWLYTRVCLQLWECKTQFILVSLFIYLCVFSHMNNCKPTFVNDWIYISNYIYVKVYKMNWETRKEVSISIFWQHCEKIHSTLLIL